MNTAATISKLFDMNTPNPHTHDSAPHELIIKGNPTDEEIAAVTAIICSLAQAEKAHHEQAAQHSTQQSLWSPQRRARAIQKLSTLGARLGLLRH